MIRIFQILAAILAVATVFFWWRDNTDWAFASGVCAAASYFLSMRFQMKARVNAADAERALENGPDPGEIDREAEQVESKNR